MTKIKGKHTRTLAALFATPTPGGLIFAELEALIAALGGEVREGEGSRVVFELHGERYYLHRPHPGKEAKRYQVRAVRAFLESLGIEP